MKVAIATSFPQDPSRPQGGVEAVSVNLVRALAAFDDLDVHVVTTDRDCAAAAESTWQGATIHRLPWVGRNVLTHATGPGRRDVSARLTELAPDVIHSHDFYGLMVKDLPIPRVFTIHGFIHGDTLVSGTRLAWLRSRVWRRVETAGWADQSHIISISPYVRERLTGIATGVIHDIDNPIAPAFFDVERNEDGRTVFSAASIGPRKNPIMLVEAVARLVADGVDVSLRLAGTSGDEGYMRRLERSIREHRLSDRVTLLGGLSSDQVRGELSAAAAFALVSLEENSPMGIEEAMAAGVPVVTSNRCGMPYMVRDGESGYLVDPNDPDDIAWRLGTLLSDGEARSAMGATGRRIAEDRFHPDRVAAKTREVYRRAVDVGRKGGSHGRR